MAGRRRAACRASAHGATSNPAGGGDGAGLRLRHPGGRARRDRARQEGSDRDGPPPRRGRGARGGPAEGHPVVPVRRPHPGPGPGPAAPGVPPSAPPPEAIRNPTLVTLLFDALDAEGRLFARRAALELLEAENRPDLVFSVFVIGNRLHLLQQFTDGPRRGGRRRRARLQRARPAGPRAGSGRHGAGGRHREQGQRQGAGGRGRRDGGRRRRGRRRLRAGGGRRRLRQRRAAGRRHGRERRAQPARQQLAVRPVRAGAAGAAARRAQGDRLLLRGPAGPQPAAAALSLGGQRGQPREPQHLRRRRAGAAHQLRLRPREDRPHEVARERAPAGPVARRPRRHPRGRARRRGGRGRDHDERPGHARRALGEHGRPADRQQQRRARRTRPRRGRHLGLLRDHLRPAARPRSTARSGASR